MERWPPIYDADDLANAIREVTSSNDLPDNFFVSEPRNRICQGDIIQLHTGLPVLHEDGQPAVFGEVTYWMVIGNTCDIDRDIESVSWSQLVPLMDLTNPSPTDEELASLKRYRYSRQFYVPAWSPDLKCRHYAADFLTPVTIHKQALLEVAQAEAKLSFPGWILLHSCLVRFLARDDGRFD